MTRELIEYVAGSLVDFPDDVSLEEIEDGDMVIYRLHVSPRDLGKVIGRRGRVARATRILLKVAAIQKHQRATLEIE
ncbi:MAG: KH domain-containing protein [Chloroflexota bacterium]